MARSKNLEVRLRAGLRAIRDYCKSFRRKGCDGCLFQGKCYLYTEGSEDLLKLSRVLLEEMQKGVEERAMDRRMKRESYSVGTDKVLMDIVDVCDEITNLKNYYEDRVKREEDSSRRYHASYTAVALAEALRIIKMYMRTPVVNTPTDSEVESEENV